MSGRRPAIRLLAAALVPLIAAVVWRASVAAQPSPPSTTTYQGESRSSGTTISTTSSIPILTTTSIPTTSIPTIIPTPTPVLTPVTPVLTPVLTPVPTIPRRFIATLAVTVQGLDVTVAPGGQTCNKPDYDHEKTCVFIYNRGESVTLTATITKSKFASVRWEGACSRNPCTVLMDSNKAVTATLVLVPY